MKESVQNTRSFLGSFRRRRGVCSATLGCFALLLLTAGCGDGRPALMAVSGQVLVDGEPLTTGNIKFVPYGARPSSGRIRDSGKFVMTSYDGSPGVVPGKHRVQVSAMQVVRGSKVKWLSPPKYTDFRTSGLEIEITEPTDDLTIELTWDGRKPPIR